MESDNAFCVLIERPLEAVLGTVLRNVSYWVLDFDVGTFSLEEPNASGVFAVSLELGGRTLEIFPSWNTCFEGVSSYHHVEARVNTPAGDSSELVNAAHLIKIGASGSSPWHRALLHTLMSVDVYGVHETPQLLRLCFPPVEIVISTGYSGMPALAGDGDELLVYSYHSAHDLLQFDFNRFRHLWRCGTELDP